MCTHIHICIYIYIYILREEPDGALLLRLDLLRVDLREVADVVLLVLQDLQDLAAAGRHARGPAAPEVGPEPGGRQRGAREGRGGPGVGLPGGAGEGGDLRHRSPLGRAASL